MFCIFHISLLLWDLKTYILCPESKRCKHIKNIYSLFWNNKCLQRSSIPLRVICVWMLSVLYGMQSNIINWVRQILKALGYSCHPFTFTITKPLPSQFMRVAVMALSAQWASSWPQSMLPLAVGIHTWHTQLWYKAIFWNTRFSFSFCTFLQAKLKGSAITVKQWEKQSQSVKKQVRKTG